MSKIGFCECGQMDGYKVTTKELAAFARKHGRKSIDEVIPLPGEKNQAHPDKCGNREHHDDMENAVYWETETGSHGWCCQECGLVLQWG